MEQPETMPAESAGTKRFLDLVRSFENAVLVTHTAAGESHARPMVLADVSGVGDLWFVTRESSPKMSEVAHDSRALVVAQQKGKYLTFSGRAEVKHEPERVRALWQDSWYVWFRGKDDPELVLICVHGEKGEYWDESSPRGVKFSAEPPGQLH